MDRFVRIGFVIKGLEWLAVIGIVVFVATAAVGWFRNRGRIRGWLHPLVRLGNPDGLFVTPAFPSQSNFPVQQWWARRRRSRSAFQGRPGGCV